MSRADLLLVGRDGNGKSSIGNSILRKKVFTVRSNSLQGSDDVFQHSAEVDGKLITIVDGLSLRDACTDGPENVRSTISLAEKAVAMFLSGFTALLIVLKYGVRFTNQEKNAIKVIRCLFGDDALKKYGVVVMSYGDSFASDVEDDGTTFDDWCRQQTGDVKDLFKECGNRYVLFNNREKDNGKIKQQFQNLMTKVEEVKSRASNYTSYSFREARFGQRKLLVESKLPELQNKTNRMLDSVSQSLRKLDDNYLNPADFLTELDSLKMQINNHKVYLQKEDEGTNSIGQLLLQISVTEASISAKRERHLRKMEYDELISSSERSRIHKKSTFSSNRNVKLFVVLFAAMIALFIIIYFFVMHYSNSPGQSSISNSSPQHNMHGSE